MASLDPLNLEPEAKKYDAFSETKELEFKRCLHKNTKIINGELKCLDCRAAWSGPGLNKLQKLLSGK